MFYENDELWFRSRPSCFRAGADAKTMLPEVVAESLLF